MTDRVRLRVKGHMPERFLEKALEEGIRFDTISRDDWLHLTLETDRKSARRTLALAEKYHLEARVVGLDGWPKLQARLKSRLTLLCGVVVCVTLLALYSSAYWQIEVMPLDDVACGAAFEQALVQYGIHPGCRKDALDKNSLRLALMADFPELTYLSFHDQGAVLRIEIAHETPPPEVYRPDESRDLVAARDAMVLSVDALFGKAAVKPGDTVRKGQLLISGEERVTKEDTRGIRALGSVIGRVWYEASCTVALQQSRTERTGRISRSSELSLFGRVWPLTQGETLSPCETEIEELPIVGMFLPLKIVRTTQYETRTTYTRLSEKEARTQAEQASLDAAKALLAENEEIYSVWTDYVSGPDALTARTVIEVHTEIAAGR